MILSLPGSLDRHSDVAAQFAIDPIPNGYGRDRYDGLPLEKEMGGLRRPSHGLSDGSHAAASLNSISVSGSLWICWRSHLDTHTSRCRTAGRLWIEVAINEDKRTRFLPDQFSDGAGSIFPADHSQVKQGSRPRKRDEVD